MFRMLAFDVEVEFVQRIIRFSAHVYFISLMTEHGIYLMVEEYTGNTDNENTKFTG